MTEELHDGWKLIAGQGDGSRADSELRPALSVHEGGGMADDEMADRVARRKLDEDEVRDLRRRLHDARDEIDRLRHDRDGDLRRERERNRKLTDYIFEKFGVKI